ncbi:hypothetical protein TeGR_g13613, partial [Tetraparma gracilis]
VYRALHLPTNTMVALKKIRIHNQSQGLPATAIREIKILKALRHENMVQLLEIVTSKGREEMDEEDEREDDRRKRLQREAAARKGGEAAAGEGSDAASQGTAEQNGDPASQNASRNASPANAGNPPRPAPPPLGNLFLVLSYAPHDLTGLLDLNFKFTALQIKHVFRQLLEVLSHTHSRSYIHRDLKCSNILILSDFTIKLADFGLARRVEPDQWDADGRQKLTNKVITLWYRPPELLQGATDYTAAVDMWSAGCILAELVIGRPILPGKAEAEQLQMIYDLVGNEGAPKAGADGRGERGRDRKSAVRERFRTRMTDTCVDLVQKLLELDPKRRISAQGALRSRYFMTQPTLPAEKGELAKAVGRIEFEGDKGGHGNYHEFQTKKRRREAKALSEATARRLMSERGVSKEQAEREAQKAQVKHLQESAAAVAEASAAAEREAAAKLERRLAEERRGREERERREKAEKLRRYRERDGEEREREEEGRRREREREEEERRREMEEEGREKAKR